VVVLSAAGVMHRHTCATLLSAGLNVVGIVCCERRGPRARLEFLRKWVARRGLRLTAGQILGSVAVAIGVADRIHGRPSSAANRATIQRAGVPVVWSDSYARPDTLDALRRLDPDIFVVHTKYIVGRRVRELARVAVIGGHPGVTPSYRGAYSPFWALYRDQRDMVGFTVFLLDDGIDTGPILGQGCIPIVPGEDSHLTLAWKGMMQSSELQARIVARLDAGESVPTRPIDDVPQDSYFDVPTLGQFLRYRRVQASVR